MAKITFVPSNQELVVPDGSDLLTVKQKHPTNPLKFGCQQGNCGVCAIEVLSGEAALTQCSSKEQQTLQKKGLGPGHRLACQCALNGDICIKLAAHTPAIPMKEKKQ